MEQRNLVSFRVSLNFRIFFREILNPALLKSSHPNKNEIKTLCHYSTLQGLSNDKSFRIKTAFDKTRDVNLSMNVNDGGREYVSLTTCTLENRIVIVKKITESILNLSS